MLKKIVSTELVLFIIIFSIYSFCSSNSINFWDSPEFIVSNYTLQSSHPPGAPFYTFLSYIIISLFSYEYAALITNLISAFFGALTIVLIYRITYLVVSQMKINKSALNVGNIAKLSALLASSSLAFSTSFWTAATEAEVYTMSFALFCTLIYIALLWDLKSSGRKKNRLLLGFSFLLGLALSIHPILITIVIPISVFIGLSKLGISFKTGLVSLTFGVLAFLCIYTVLYLGLISVGASLDIYAVNSLGLDVNIGFITFYTVLLCILVIGIFYSHAKKLARLNTISKALVVFALGVMFNALPLLTSKTNSLVAEKVDNGSRLKEYLSAKRFGVDNIPLIYGPNYNAQLDTSRPFISDVPKYTYDASSQKYIEVDDGKYSRVNYSHKFNTLFPRMYDASNEVNYKSWTTIKGTNVNHMVNGEELTFQVPTLRENLNFFYTYQLIWLNLRYFMWNFTGRQNDYHGLGYTKNGNWISGFNVLDSYRLGNFNLAPSYYKQNKSKDAYYFIPLILGLLGLFSLFPTKKYFVFSILLFLTFGIGITLYVNPLPSSILIRERDYIFIGSYIVFSFWIGLSVPFIANKLKNVNNTLYRAIIGLLFLGAPVQMFAKGWDNHQNTGDNFAYEFGKAYLDSCPEQAILITNGDNMTFPLWYLQQVENYRTDVRVINFDQLNIDTHISNLAQQKDKSLPIKFDLNKHLYINGVQKLIPLKQETDEPINLEVLTNFLNATNTLINWNGKLRHYIPGSIFQIPIDTSFYQNKSKLPSYNIEVLPAITWQFQKPFYGLNDVVLINLIKNNIENRPICFALNGKKNHIIGLDSFLLQKGMVGQLLPFKRISNTDNPKLVDTKISTEILIKNSPFNGMGDTNKYIKDESRTYAQQILRQNFYYSAQALLEEHHVKEALEVLDKSLELFPNEAVPFKEYAFSIGKLYLRLGATDKGNSVCLLSMQNLRKELEWMLSTNPSNAIINVRHATKLYNMYAQMAQQLNTIGLAAEKTKINELQALNSKLKNWQRSNWPYSEL